MAEEDLSLEEPKNEEESAESGGMSKMTLIIIAVAATLILGGGGTAAFFLLTGDDEQVAEVTEAEPEGEATSDTPAKKVPPPPKGDAIYVSVPDPFLVNLMSGKRQRMMQVKVQLMVRSPEAKDAVNDHMPLIRNNLLDYFSAADADEVRTREGRQALKNGALKVTQKVIQEQAGFEAVEMILFTGFVVQ
ncbi:MAG: flagellar basal body-associated FliL family protein [Gammaproteobacteria bacterium]|nr:flagellar basal body-associated FliL family protein [Gammaproteobacteria bacterium]NNJ72301.1 flagellar basal body-associated protein FliL [Enterobacterales bacterium]